MKAKRGECRNIYLYLRCEDGSKRVQKVIDFAPYFYAPSKLGVYTAITGEPVARIEAQCPEDVPKLRENYEHHYEADIPFARRFLIDTGIRNCVRISSGGVEPSSNCGIPLRTWFLDIEVLAESFPDIEAAEQPIISISLYDSYVDRYYTFFWHKRVERFTVKKGILSLKHCGIEEKLRWEIRAAPTEEYMLMDFLATWDSVVPDVVAGWNVGFDIDYLSNRMKRYNMRLNTSGSIVFDLLEAYKKVGPNQRSYALKEVTLAEGVECKEDISFATDLMSGWEKDPREMILYNLRDVWRIVRINEIHKLIDFYISIKDVVGLEDIFRHLKTGVYAPYPTLVIVDTVVLRKARQRGVVLPSSGQAQRQAYRGAVVLEPPGGLWENVAVFDMSRYYPSLIISFNISPETKERLVDPVNRIWKFREQPEGLIPSAVRELLEVREKLEQELSKHKPGSLEYQDLENKIMAVKGIVNSFYGVMANPFFRLFDVDVAATITGLAREGILYVVEAAKKLGYRALYGDTDSIFVQVPFEKAEDLAQELTNLLRRYFMEKYGLRREPVLKLKFEKYYRRIFFKPRTKKRYAGLLVWKKGQKVEPPKIDITGFEAVRTDTAPFTVEAETKVFEAILSGADKSKILALVHDLDLEARKRPLSDIALYEGLQKDLHDYRSKSVHVRAALYSNMYLGTNFGKGSKVRYVYVKSVRCKGLPPTDVVAFDPETEEHVAKCFEVDWQRQLERVLYSPIREILKSIGINIGKRVVAHSFF